MLTSKVSKAENIKNEPMRLTERIGQTTYKVNVHFSETSKETIGDKDYPHDRKRGGKSVINAHSEPLSAQLKPSAATAPDYRKEGKMNTKLTILYERLSREDERENESVSIENQKAFLEEYAIRNGFTNFIHLTDDGWSYPQRTKNERVATARLRLYIPLLPSPVSWIFPCEQIHISFVSAQNPPALLPPKSVCQLHSACVADAAASPFPAPAGSKGITH